MEKNYAFWHRLRGAGEWLAIPGGSALVPRCDAPAKIFDPSGVQCSRNSGGCFAVALRRLVLTGTGRPGNFPSAFFRVICGSPLPIRPPLQSTHAGFVFLFGGVAGFEVFDAEEV